MLRSLTAFMFCIVLESHAQSISTRMGARGAAMGYASFVLQDESALFNNVGALSKQQQSSTFFACETNTGLPGADRKAAGVTFVNSAWAAGLGFFRFGDERYNEQMVSVGFSNSLGIASLGAKVNYIQYQAEGFGTRAAMTLDVAGLAQITPLLSIGAGIFNVTQSFIGDGEALPVTLITGLGFKPNDHFILTTEVEKQIMLPAIWKMGMEYAVHKKILFRTGINLSPSAVFGGAGTRGRRTAIDCSIQYSRLLGLSVHGAASYQFGKSVKK